MKLRPLFFGSPELYEVNYSVLQLPLFIDSITPSCFYFWVGKERIGLRQIDVPCVRVAIFWRLIPRMSIQLMAWTHDSQRAVIPDLNGRWPDGTGMNVDDVSGGRAVSGHERDGRNNKTGLVPVFRQQRTLYLTKNRLW